MHPLLRRQLRRCNIEPTKDLQPLLDAISDAYESADQDREMVDRSMELVSNELMQRNESLAKEIKEKERAMESLQSSERALIEAVTQLKKMDKERAAFINAAAHELGTPLTPLKLQVRLVRDATGKRHDDSVDILERNVERLTHLVRDLLDSSKLQSGNLDMQMETADLAALVRGAVSSFQPVAEQVGVELRTSELEFMEVHCDIIRTSQVLDNLLSNALKCTKAGAVEVSANREGDRAFVSVRDTGIGISPQDMQKLFEPFSQVGKMASTSGSGTGLGLHICKGIIERSGGEIWAESAGLGEGSTFSFTLPLVEK